MNIGLYGIKGVYNFGCEAIVRGAYQFLNSIYPGCKIIYFSYSLDFDKIALADLNIEMRPIIRNKVLIKRVINKILKLFNSNRRFLMFDVDSVIDNVDLLLSIGGDIYTIPKILREKKKYPYYNSLVDFCDRAIKKGKQVIVYGASVGPWGEYKAAIDYNVNALSKYKIILCREKETVKYLVELGFRNVCFFPDPAFQVRGEGDYRKRQYIGINFSPLAFDEVYGGYGITYVKKVAKLVDAIYERFGIELLLIPHVISKLPNDNDLWFMEKIKSCMKHRSRVQIVDTGKGFLGVKEYISECKVVIAARMHCAINAIEENVPTIFISYSQKSVGMCKYVYGDSCMLVDIQRLDQDLLEILGKTLDNEWDITQKLKMRNEEIQRYYQENIDFFKEKLSIKGK